MIISRHKHARLREGPGLASLAGSSPFPHTGEFPLPATAVTEESGERRGRREKETRPRGETCPGSVFPKRGFSRSAAEKCAPIGQITTVQNFDSTPLDEYAAQVAGKSVSATPRRILGCCDDLVDALLPSPQALFHPPVHIHSYSAYHAHKSW